MIYKICELVKIDGQLVQRERDATQEEAIEIDARKAAPPLVPQSVTRFQGIEALAQSDYLDALETMMSDPATPAQMVRAYRNALHFERDSDTVATFAQALGMTSAQVDQLFILAATITA